jgi:hypothetical protein
LPEISISIVADMELPNSPFYRRSSAIVAGIIGLAAIVALVGWARLMEVDNPPPTQTAAAVTTTVTTVTTPPTTTTRPEPTTTRRPGVLWTKTGKDVGKSPGFRARDDLRIDWSFDCSSFRKLGGGNFKITGDGAFEGIQIQDFAVGGRGSRAFPFQGFGHLLVDSVCDSWTVTVVGD